MKIITRYILREHLGPFVFAATALTSIMLLQFVGKQLGDLVGKGLPTHVLLEFFALSLPLTLALTMPMAVLVAVLYAYSRLAAENEITALRASGVSMRWLLVPTLLAGAALSVGMLVFNDQVLSWANHQLAVLQRDIARTKPSFALREQIINAVADQKLYLRAAHIDRGSQNMQDVVIWDLSDPAHRRTVYADHGTLAVAPNGRDIILHLFDGHTVEIPAAQPAELTRMYFAQDFITVPGVMNSFQATDADSASKGDREMSVCEMQRQFAAEDFRWQEARYQRLKAEAAQQQAQHKPNVQMPEPPSKRNPFGLGSIYCGFITHVFGVKTAAAATLPVRAAPQQKLSAQQRPIAQQKPAAQQPASQPKQFTAQDSVSRMQKLADLRAVADIQNARVRENVARYQRVRYDIEIQKKFSLAAACIIFVLLGPPIALRFPGGGVGMVIGVSFGVFALYYVGLNGGEVLANAQYIAPFWAMWGANLIMFIAGIVMTLRMNKISGATRGSNWSELRSAAADALRRWMRLQPRKAV